MRIVFLSGHPWDSTYQLSGHNLARAAAAAGHDTAFVCAPVCLTHLAAPQGGTYKKILASVLKPSHVSAARVFVHQPFSLLPVHYRFPFNRKFNFANWHRFCVPKLGRTRLYAEYNSPDLAVVDHPFQFALAKSLRPKRIVVRVLDRLDDFNNAPAALTEELRKAVKEADAVVVSAKPLIKYAEALGARHCAYVPHGVDPQRFSSSHEEPADLANFRRPRAIYVGALAAWFDTGELDRAAALLPDVQFLLIGAQSAGFIQPMPASNVHLLGPKPFSTIAAHLQHSDVALIPFRQEAGNRLTHAIHPIKLYEYLAAGLPVAAPRLDELSSIQGSLHFYGQGGLATAIQNALAEGKHQPDTALIESVSWKARLQQIFDEVS